MKTYLYNHDSEENAYIVEDYPWGYSMRTTVRFWLETNKRGSRFCKRTLDPKTSRWCAAKKSTYAKVGVMFLDNENHIQWTGIRNPSKEDLEDFKLLHFDHLCKFRKNHITDLEILQKAFDRIGEIKFEIKETQCVRLT